VDNVSCSVNAYCTPDLGKEAINKICLLKNSHWKYGIDSQINWFGKNIKKKDIHVFLNLKDNLIGYTLLRKRTFLFKIDSETQEKQADSYGREREREYWLLDTHIIKKEFRGLGHNFVLMKELSKQIKNDLAFLICADRLVKYYTRFKWELINNNKFTILDHPHSLNGMIYNFSNNFNNNKKDKVNLNFFINK
jgi:hypothetical protein